MKDAINKYDWCVRVRVFGINKRKLNYETKNKLGCFFCI